MSDIDASLDGDGDAAHERLLQFVVFGVLQPSTIGLLLPELMADDQCELCKEVVRRSFR